MCEFKLEFLSYIKKILFVFLQQAALVGPPDILVTTPACIPKIKCFSAEALDDSLEILVLDEVRMLSNLLSSFISSAL